MLWVALGAAIPLVSYGVWYACRSFGNALDEHKSRPPVRYDDSD